MLGWLEGEVLQKDEDRRLLVRIGPVGLWVFVPQPVWDEVQPGDIVRLYTHLVIRENEWQLYGFSRPEDIQAFTLLLQVNGIGPRLALAILSHLTPEALRAAVVEERPEILQRLPGIGRKTARRILLALQDRWKAETIPTPPQDDINMQVFEALVALGYSVVEAQTAIQRLPRHAPPDVEERLRLALQYLGSR